MQTENEKRNAPVRLMSHLVAGFPDAETSVAVADALVRGGTSILEVQLAFSDPSADGPAIQTASTVALEKGFSTRKGLEIVKRIRDRHPETPIYVMTYGSLAFTPGVENFVVACKEAGASACIVPDLPFDDDEGLTEACRKHGLENIPVAAPSMRRERLEALASRGFEYVYAALRAGTTGSETTIDRATLDFIDAVGARGSKVLGGFGIRNGEQSRVLCRHVHAVVAGSVFVNLLLERPDTPEGRAEALAAIEAKARELSGIGG